MLCGVRSRISSSVTRDDRGECEGTAFLGNVTTSWGVVPGISPDSCHYYQGLIRKKWGESKTLLLFTFGEFLGIMGGYGYTFTAVQYSRTRSVSTKSKICGALLNITHFGKTQPI